MITGDALEQLYATLNRPELVHPDPLEVLCDYPDVGDREVAALVAACLSYGRVKSILASVRSVLERLTPSPARFLADASAASLRELLADFRHRFATGAEMAALLLGARRLIAEHGSLNAATTTPWCPRSRPSPPSFARRQAGWTRISCPAPPAAVRASGSTCSCAGWCAATPWTPGAGRA
jgi:hypothetical protein